MALTITQLYDPSFLSQLGPEYVCTGFMFDENIQMESIESQLSKEGFMSGIKIAGPGGAEEIAAKKGEASHTTGKKY
jgi:hypothetical protein